jgi:hypothetical protein
MIDDSYDDGQGQQNLGICERITNRGDWNLTRHVINHSKIRWALGILKPFKSAGTDGIVLLLLQQGAKHVVAHLCHIFRACMAYGFIPTAWRQTLFQSLGNLIIPRLRLIILSACHLFF